MRTNKHVLKVHSSLESYPNEADRIQMETGIKCKSRLFEFGLQVSGILDDAMHTIVSGALLKIWKSLLEGDRPVPITTLVQANLRCKVYPLPPGKSPIHRIATIIPGKASERYEGMIPLLICLRGLFREETCTCKRGTSPPPLIQDALGLQEIHCQTDHYVLLQLAVSVYRLYSRILRRKIRIKDISLNEDLQLLSELQIALLSPAKFSVKDHFIFAHTDSQLAQGPLRNMWNFASEAAHQPIKKCKTNFGATDSVQHSKFAGQLGCTRCTTHRQLMQHCQDR